MKKVVLIFLVLMTVTSCKKPITEQTITKINGYWEIEKVILADGSKKEYKVNTTIDFFELRQAQLDNKMVGFRQKVMPQLDGTYATNNLKELLSISNEEGIFYINYTTDYGKWKEEIVALEDSVLVVKNKDNIEYHYKKQIPFSIK